MADATLGKDVITFKLKEWGDTGKVIKSHAFDIEVVADLKAFELASDKKEYTAGDDIKLTIKALKQDPKFPLEPLKSVLHDTYNETDVLTIQIVKMEVVDNEPIVVLVAQYYRSVEFVNGIGLATIPAKVAGKDQIIRVIVPPAASVDDPVLAVDIKVGEASKFVLTKDGTDLVVEAQDAAGNVVRDFAGEKLVNIAYPAAMANHLPVGIDDEDNLKVTFGPDTGTARITFDVELVDGTYTVTYGGITGTKKFG